ncbi:ribulose-phosphate 3-epimerase [Chloroflexota bacterium]
MAKNIQVVPAILSADLNTLEDMLRQTKTFTSYVQIDIMDGLFVPSQSITWQQLATINIKLGWEAHLMVLHPEDYLSGFRQAGAQKVIFHYEATASPGKVISEARKLGLNVGLAVNPDTSVSAFIPLTGGVDSVLFLTVNPGFYGSKFIPEVMDKVTELWRLRPELEIGIDGGIKESNIRQVAGSGVDVIYVGSAIFLQPKPSESYRNLLALANNS